MVDSKSDNWMALESNPEVMNPFVKTLGFDTDKFCFQDLLSIEDWAQDMIQKPVLAVMFLYTIKEVTEKHKE